MVDGLLGLWHDTVVGSNDDDSDIGHLCTTGTHGCERFVTWSIKEGHLAAVFECNMVGTNMLCDTTGLTCNDIGAADVVEQLSLTMIDMTHHCDDRWTAHEFVLIVFLVGKFLLNLFTYIFSLKTELVSYEIDSFGIKTLVDRHHNADAHACLDDLNYTDVHHCCKVVGCHKLGQLQYLALCCFCLFELCSTFSCGVALILAVLDTLLVRLVGKTSKCFLHLLLYILLTDLLFEVVVALLAVLVLLILAVLSVLAVFLTTLIARLLVTAVIVLGIATVAS